MVFKTSTTWIRKYSSKAFMSFEIKKMIKQRKRPDSKKILQENQRGDLIFVNTKISNPTTNKMVLQGLDGTTEKFILVSLE